MSSTQSSKRQRTSPSAEEAPAVSITDAEIQSLSLWACHQLLSELALHPSNTPIIAFHIARQKDNPAPARAKTPPTDFLHYMKDLDWTVHEATDEWDQYERSEDLESGAEMISDHICKVVEEVLERCEGSSRAELREAGIRIMYDIAFDVVDGRREPDFAGYLIDTKAVEVLSKGIERLLDQMIEGGEDLGGVRKDLLDMYAFFRDERESRAFKNLKEKLGGEESEEEGDGDDKL